MAINSGTILRSGRTVIVKHEIIENGRAIVNSREAEVVTTDALGIWVTAKNSNQEVMIPWNRVIEIWHVRENGEVAR